MFKQTKTKTKIVNVTTVMKHPKIAMLGISIVLEVVAVVVSAGMISSIGISTGGHLAYATTHSGGNIDPDLFVGGDSVVKPYTSHSGGNIGPNLSVSGGDSVVKPYTSHSGGGNIGPN